MPTANIRWVDGFAMVEPDFPESILKKLTYWHRSIAWDDVQMRRVSTGESRQLYTIRQGINDRQVIVKQLITMPGFIFRIKEALQDEGWTVNIVDQRTPPPPFDFVKGASILREYQYEALATALSSGGGILSLPTGMGKTRISAAIINSFNPDSLKLRGTGLSVFTVSDKDICRKNYMDLVECLPDRDVGILMSGKRKMSDDVMVVTLDSLHNIPLDEIGILIGDEVHTAATESRTEKLMQATKALKWGVSATPTGRYDGRDLATEGLFGPVIYEKTYADGVACGALVPIKVYWIKSPPPEIGIDKYNNMSIRTAQYRHGVTRNAIRNRMIGDLIQRIPDEKQTLCIMQYTDHMDKILEHCPTVRYVHAEESDDSIAKRKFQRLTAVSKNERQGLYDQFSKGEIRKVLSTYVYKQGVNFPQLSIVINAGGGGSEIVAKQIPGRESRNIDGKTEAYLVDFWHDWDVKLDKLGEQIIGPIHRDDRSREKTYKSLGFSQVWLDNISELPFLQR